MALPKEIPSEISIRGIEGREIAVEDFANFLRDIVFLHDRIWMMSSRDYSESKLGYSFFYTRNGRPIQQTQKLKLISVRMESPFDLVVNIPSALSYASAAWIFFRLLRGALLLPGEIEKQYMEIDRGNSAIEKQELEKTDLVYTIDEKRRRSRDHRASIPLDVREDILELAKPHTDSFEERISLVERDVRRLSEDEIVVTEIKVSHYVRVRDKE